MQTLQFPCYVLAGMEEVDEDSPELSKRERFDSGGSFDNPGFISMDGAVPSSPPTSPTAKTPGSPSCHAQVSMTLVQPEFLAP